MATPAAKAKTGALKVSVSGLPKKTKAKIRVAGASGIKSITKSSIVKKLKPGSYSITVSDVKKGKYWYRGVSQSTTKLVSSGKTVRAAIHYQKATSPTPTPTTPITPLRFNFSGAVGVAIAKSSGASSTAVRSGRTLSPASTGSSGLLAVHADGSTTSAITSADAFAQTPTRIYRGPDGAVVLQFSNPVSPETGRLDTMGCALIRIPANSDRGACVDPWLVDIPSAAQPYPTNPRIQFDASGAVYYIGLIQEDRDPRHQVVDKPVFRRSSGGTVTDIAPDLVAAAIANGFMTRANFAVSSAGTVYFSGAGTDPYGSVYRALPDGTTSLVLSGQNIGFLSVLADNNLYFGANQGVFRFDAGTGQLDSKRWLATYRSWDGLPEVTNDCDQLAVAFTGDPQASCPGITYPRALVTTADGHTVGDIAVSPTGDSWSKLSGGLLVRYFPDPVFVGSSVRIESAAVAAGDKVILAGTDVSGTPRLVSLDDATGTERALLGNDTQIDIYHLVYSASRGLVMFDGLDFADNRYVIGSVDLDSGAVQISPAAKLADFQAL